MDLPDEITFGDTSSESFCRAFQYHYGLECNTPAAKSPLQETTTPLGQRQALLRYGLFERI